jgi:hypothetical protein
VSGEPSARFLRFARALALASGVAPFGCGDAGLHDNTRSVGPSPDGGYTTGTTVPLSMPPYCTAPCGIPAPPQDAGEMPDADAGDTASVLLEAEGGVVGLDAAIERIPVGGPQAAPALPAEWWGAERA